MNFEELENTLLELEKQDHNIYLKELENAKTEKEKKDIEFNRGAYSVKCVIKQEFNYLKNNIVNENRFKKIDTVNYDYDDNFIINKLYDIEQTQEQKTNKVKLYLYIYNEKLREQAKEIILNYLNENYKNSINKVEFYNEYLD